MPHSIDVDDELVEKVVDELLMAFEPTMNRSATWALVHNYAERLEQLERQQQRERRREQIIVGYHATNASAAQKILANGFRCGRKGLAGGAIYFATSEEDASRKSNNGNDIVLKCRVTLGRTLTLDEDGDPTMTLDKLNGKGYDSVKILRNGDEYAVYEPSRVSVLSKC